MPAIDPVPESFEIEATSLEACEPENETFVILARVQGTYDVRRFLDDNGVDEKRIACAIAELGQSKRVKVKKQRTKTRVA
jgi:hypothetical protein